MKTDTVLIIDKPEGLTSHDVVSRVRKILKTRRVGHSGTLDPFATGVLVVCVNRATRLVQFLTGENKEYLATMRLGVATDTGDLTGTPISETTDAGSITAESIREALTHFRGRINQIPPMYSAKKIRGVKLYELARKGMEIEREPIEVEISELEICDSRHQPPVEPDRMTRDFNFRVVCSSGTYIRTLAEDIGKHLGIGAHLSALRRTRSGRCHIDQAMTLEELGEIVAGGESEPKGISMSEALDMEEIIISDFERGLISNGRSISRTGSWQQSARAKLCDEHHKLLAIARFNAESSIWKPDVVLESAGQDAGQDD